MPLPAEIRISQRRNPRTEAGQGNML